MWNNLRSDLKEFATSIASDGTSVLENIDSKLKENDVLNNIARGADTAADADSTKNSQELMAAIDPELAYTNNNNTNNSSSKHQDADLSIPAKNMDDHDDDADDAENNQGFNHIMMADAIEEANRRMGLDITFLTPLLRSEVNGVKHTNPTTPHHNDATINPTPATADPHAPDSPDAPSSNNNNNTNNTDETTETDEKNNPTLESDETTEPKNKEAENSNETKINNASPSNDDNIQITEQSNKPYENYNYDDEDDIDDDEDEEPIILFLQSFHIQSKTEDISNLLSNQPNLVQQFETLVPLQVTYEQFWQRFYYRCDPIRIIQEWEEEDERIRLHRQQLIGKGVQSVQNIFGGALNAIKKGAVAVAVTTAGSHDGSSSSHTNTPTSGGSNIYKKYQAELEEKQKAMLISTTTTQQQQEGEDYEDGSGGNGDRNKSGTSIGTRGGILGGALGMFAGKGGRPPFVLNTAESDDDEEEVYEEEEEDGLEEENDDDDEESEEELGWGSDDDDDDDDDLEYEEEEDDTLNESEQEIIVFEDNNDDNDVVVSNDVIDEINNLKFMLENAQSAKNQSEMKAQTLEEELTLLKEQMKLQQMQLKEEVTSSTLTSEGITNVPPVQNDEMNNLLSQLNNLQVSKRDAEAKAESLATELASCKEEMKKQTSTFANTLEEKIAKLTMEHQEAMASSESTIIAMKAELEKSQNETKEANQMIHKLKEDLDVCKEDAKKQSINFAKTLEDKVAMVRAEQQKGTSTLLSSASAQEGSSLSSAVEIPPVHDEPEMDTAKNGDDDEDGWGDSWSDDDDDGDN